MRTIHKGYALLFAVRRKLRLSVGTALVAVLLSGVSLVMAAQLEVFTTSVIPIPGPEARPGRTLTAPETSSVSPSSGPAVPSSGPATTGNSIAGRILNTVALAEGSATATGGDVLPQSATPAPLVSMIGPFLNTIRLVQWVAVPQDVSAPPSTPSVVPQSAIQPAYPPAHIEPITQGITPTRALIAATLRGRGVTAMTTVVGETRALLASHIEGLPKQSFSSPVMEQRSLHTEADSRIPVVQRVVQPLVGSVARQVSYGGLAPPYRGGSMGVTASNMAPSSLLSAGMTKSVTPLVNSPAQWANTILVFSGAVSPSQPQAQYQAYSLFAQTGDVGRLSHGALSPDNAVVASTGGPLSSSVDGLALAPTSQPVAPAQNDLPAIRGPGTSAPQQDAIMGVTHTLVSPSSTPTPTNTPTPAGPTPTLVPSLGGPGLLLMALAFGVVALLALRAHAQRKEQA